MGILGMPDREAILFGAAKFFPSGAAVCSPLPTLAAVTFAGPPNRCNPKRGRADRPSIAANIATPNTTATISWMDHQKLDCNFSLRSAIVRRSSRSELVDNE